MDRKEYRDRVDDHEETSDQLDDHKEITDRLYYPIESRDRLDDRKDSKEREEECKEIKIEIDVYETSADSPVLASIRKPKQESALKEEFTGWQISRLVFLVGEFWRNKGGGSAGCKKFEVS